MDKSEINRHKMYEHFVPLSPFEENKEGAVMYESISPQRKENGNRNNSHPEDLRKSIITTTSNTPAFKCEGCDTSFTSEQGLEQHEKYASYRRKGCCWQ